MNVLLGIKLLNIQTMLLLLVGQCGSICTPITTSCAAYQSYCGADTSLLLANLSILQCELKSFTQVNITSCNFTQLLVSTQNLQLTNTNCLTNCTFIVNQTAQIAGFSGAYLSAKAEQLQVSDIRGSRLLLYAKNLTVSKGIILEEKNCPTRLVQFNIDQIPSYFLANGTVNFNPANFIPSLYLQFYSMLLVAQNISLLGSNILSPLLLLVCNSLVATDSTVNSTGLGCKNGLGKGISVNSFSKILCQPTGGSGNGYGGYTYGQEDECYMIVQGFRFILHDFPYIGKEDQFQGSGGFGKTLTPGGGVMHFYVVQSAQLLGQNYFTSNGVSAQGSSGGSGGAITLKSKAVNGQGIFKAEGGSSQGAGGSGGLIFIYLSSQVPGTFSGQISVNGGRSGQGTNGQQGSIWTAPCKQGEQLNLNKLECGPCPAGTYKSIPEMVCVACPKQKGLTPSQKQGGTSLMDCFLPPKTTFRDNPVKMFLMEVDWLVILIGAVIGIVLLLLGLLIRFFYKRSNNNLSESYDIQSAADQVANQILSQELRNSEMFKTADVLFHVARIMTEGNNTYSRPWHFGPMPPALGHIINQTGFTEFAKQFNKAAKWSLLQTVVSGLSCLIYPLHWYLHAKFKKQKFQRVMKVGAVGLVKEGQVAWSIKRSKNPDYTCFFIDLFEYKKADLKYFMLQTPLVITLSGEGTFIRPFYLFENDPFFNLLFFIVNRNTKLDPATSNSRKLLLRNLVEAHQRKLNTQALERFLTDFNKLCYSIDLSAPSFLLRKVLKRLLEFLDSWDRSFFSRHQIRLQLVLIETQADRSFATLLQSNDQPALKLMARTLLDSSSKLSLFIFNPKLPAKVQQGKSQQALDQPPSQARPNLLGRICGVIRFVLLSHLDVADSSIDYYTVLFLQVTLLILSWLFCTLNALQLRSEYAWWQLAPYPLVEYVSTGTGFLWVLSNSYGIGKAFVVLNAMSLVMSVIQLGVVLGEMGQVSTAYIVLKGMRVAPFLLMNLTERRLLLESTKLNKLNINRPQS